MSTQSLETNTSSSTRRSRKSPPSTGRQPGGTLRGQQQTPSTDTEPLSNDSGWVDVEKEDVPSLEKKRRRKPKRKK